MIRKVRERDMDVEKVQEKDRKLSHNWDEEEINVIRKLLEQKLAGYALSFVILLFNIIL